MGTITDKIEWKMDGVDPLSIMLDQVASVAEPVGKLERDDILKLCEGCKRELR